MTCASYPIRHFYPIAHQSASSRTYASLYSRTYMRLIEQSTTKIAKETLESRLQAAGRVVLKSSKNQSVFPSSPASRMATRITPSAVSNG